MNAFVKAYVESAASNDVVGTFKSLGLQVKLDRADDITIMQGMFRTGLGNGEELLESLQAALKKLGLNGVHTEHTRDGRFVFSGDSDKKMAQQYRIEGFVTLPEYTKRASATCRVDIRWY
jgi:hypothetical protein